MKPKEMFQMNVQLLSVVIYKFVLNNCFSDIQIENYILVYIKDKNYF